MLLAGSTMALCPCCNSPLLRHVRQSHLYWFCPSCRQDIPESTLSSDLLLLDSPSDKTVEPAKTIEIDAKTAEILAQVLPVAS